MNRKELDVLLELKNNSNVNQRLIAENTGYSLGQVNKSIKFLVDNEYIDTDYHLLEKAIELFLDNSPTNAVILAAGVGKRMVPINRDYPKSLLEVNDEPLIERLIKQLKEVGIHHIQVVVGYCKEKFEYLMDKYDVDLVVNNQYLDKNNYFSLLKCSRFLGNTYIVPSDLWFRHNPFRKNELYSWYMLSNAKSNNSDVCYKKNYTIVKSTEANRMVGLAYLTKEDAQRIVEKLKQIDLDSRLHNEFWEYSLYNKNGFEIEARVIKDKEAVEINTYEDLRTLDDESVSLKSEAIDVLKSIFNTDAESLTDFTALKKGMTNRSFMFTFNDKRYIMRIPGEGTEQLINRKEEASVYDLINSKNICDNVVYINPKNGFKVTEFIENTRVCDAENDDDLRLCMSKLKELHNLKLSVNHSFDIFEQIEFYESLFNANSAYMDYQRTKENTFVLREFINSCDKDLALTHIDAVPDNFLIYENDGKQDVRLIDWEYSGMQDPHVDVAMFCIYSLYNREQVDNLINIYFENKCDIKTRIKIYCYISACGLLWSNWCEYKRTLGVEFGDYSLRQYRFAKDYYKIAKEEIERINENEE